jgi:hypothetical protein
MPKNIMTIDDYIQSVKEDIESLESEDTSDYGCCDMLEWEITLGMNQHFLGILEILKNNKEKK